MIYEILAGIILLIPKMSVTFGRIEFGANCPCPKNHHKVTDTNSSFAFRNAIG